VVTPLAEEPQDNGDEIPALAGVLMQALNLAPASAMQAARALAGYGVHVDVAQQADATWAAQTLAYWLNNPEPELTKEQVADAAQEERLIRLLSQCKQSRAQLVPSASAHWQINQILDEMGV
jgi:L-2-hydroxyglutarate oxidase LhgO